MADRFPAAHRVWDVAGGMGRLNEELGKTIIIVTHDPHAAQFARRELHLEKGVLERTIELNRPARP